MKKRPQPGDDIRQVFLSHNSHDKAHVKALADWLGKNGVTFFLDENDLEPGDVLTDELGRAMERSRSAIICIGPYGEGPWQKEEIDTLLNKSIKLSRTQDEFRIIPVLLPGADTAKLRWFLETRLWVDLQKGITDNEAELERLKCAILGERGRPILAEPTFNPYRGLESFQFEDARFFFGRSKESRELAQKLKDWRFAAIVGPSGNGKSSLARAGLATEAALEVLPDIPLWQRLVARPGRNLLKAILDQLFAKVPNETRGAAVEAALARICPPGQPFTSQLWASGLDNELQTFFPDEKTNLLIIIDQFEEVFTHRPLQALAEDERQKAIQFQLDALAQFRSIGSHRWHLVLTLRSDFCPRCVVSDEFWSLLEKDHLQIDLDELDKEGWRAAIKGPAARAGAYLEAGLVEAMLQDVYRQRGSMPLLQLALQELWRLRDGACLTHAAYHSIGGVGKALQIKAEGCLEKFKMADPEFWDIARNLFVRLTALGEGVSDTRRRMDRKELDWVAADAAKVEHVIGTLSNADNRLIVTDDDALEVTHEVLIRDCPTIRGWIENVRGEIPMLRRLTHAARQWDEHGRNVEYLSTADQPLELKRWVSRTSLWLTKLEKEFWAESRHRLAAQLAEKRDKERKLRFSEREARLAKTRYLLWLKITAMVGCAALAAAAFAIYAMGRHRESEEAAHKALSKSFVRIIGQNEEITPIEVETLWELAELPEANEPVRDQLLEQWLSGDPLLALNHEEVGLYAAVGISPARHRNLQMALAVVAELEKKRKTEPDHINRLARSLVVLTDKLDAPAVAPLYQRAAECLAKTLKNTQEEEPFYYLTRLVEAMLALTSKLEVSVAAPLVQRGAERLVTALVNPKKNDSTRYDPFPDESVFVALTAQLDAAAVAGFVGRLVTALENPQMNDPDKLSRLGAVLEAFAAKLESPDIASNVERLAKALMNPQETDALRLALIGRALATVTAKLNGPTSASVAQEGATRLGKALESPYVTEPSLIQRLAEALSALTAKLDVDAAAPILQRPSERLIKVLENPQVDDEYFLLSFVQSALTALIAKLDAPTAASHAGRLVTALESPQEKNFTRLRCLAKASVALAVKLDTKAAALLAERIVKALENPQKTHPDRPYRLAEVLAVLVAKLDAPSASAPLIQKGVGRLVETLENSQENDPEKLSQLGESLVVLTARFNPTAITRIVERLAEALVKPQENDPTRLALLGKTLVALAARLETPISEHLVQKGAERLVNAIENPLEDNAYHLFNLTSALAALTVKIEPSPALQLKHRALASLLSKQISHPERGIERELSIGCCELSGSLPNSRAGSFCIQNGFQRLRTKDIPKLENEMGPVIEQRERRILREACLALDIPALANLLKAPFCRGELQKLVLLALEQKTGKQFDGNLWKFVETAAAECYPGVDLDGPVRRIKLEEVIAEVSKHVKMPVLKPAAAKAVTP